MADVVSQLIGSSRSSPEQPGELNGKEEEEEEQPSYSLRRRRVSHAHNFGERESSEEKAIRKDPLPALTSWYNNLSCVSSSEDDRKLVVIFVSTETVSSSLLSDFIHSIHSNPALRELPFVLVFSMATSSRALHGLLPCSTVSKLALRRFYVKPPLECFRAIEEHLYMDALCPLHLGKPVREFLAHHFVYENFSLDAVFRVLKCLVMQHMDSQALAHLAADLEGAVKLTSADIEQIRGLLSVRLAGCAEPEPKSQSPSKSRKRGPSKSTKSCNEPELQGWTTKVEKWISDIKHHRQQYKTSLRLLVLTCQELLPGWSMDSQENQTRLQNDITGNSVHEIAQYQPLFTSFAKRTVPDLLHLCGAWVRLLGEMGPAYKTEQREVTELSEQFRGVVSNSGKSQVSVAKRSRASSARQKRQAIYAVAQKVQNEQGPLRQKLCDWFKGFCEHHLRPLHKLPLSEIFCCNSAVRLQKVFQDQPREVICEALVKSHLYPKLNHNANSRSRQRKIARDTMSPDLFDICIVYQLYEEAAKVISVSDWFGAFRGVVVDRGDPDEEHGSDDDDEDLSPKEDSALRTRFLRSFSTLNWMGFFKDSNHRVDYVAKLCFMSSA